MVTRSSRMYSSSPTFQRNDEGRVGMTRQPMPSTMDDMGLRGGVGQQGEMGEMQIHTSHEAERGSVLDRHQQEIKEMYARHINEISNMNQRHFGHTNDIPPEQAGDYTGFSLKVNHGKPNKQISDETIAGGQELIDLVEDTSRYGK